MRNLLCICLCAVVLTLGCRTDPKTHTLGAAGVPPPSLLVTDWYVDPTNTSGCASDTNSGTSATCGAAGIGPLRHKSQIAARWGTWSPVLTVPLVTITYLSGDTDDSDPGLFTPTLVGGTLFQTAPLPSPSFQGSLNAVTQRNRAAGTPLESTFTTTSGALAADMLLVNSTRGGSRSFARVNLGGGTWQLAQPHAPWTMPTFAFSDPVDTWVSGDAILGYVLPVVNLSRIGGYVDTFSFSTFAPGNVVQGITIGQGNAGSNTVVDLASLPFLVDDVASRAVAWQGPYMAVICGSQNVAYESQLGVAGWFDFPIIAGGFAEGGTVSEYTTFTDDIALAGTSTFIGATIDNLYLEHSAVLQVQADTPTTGVYGDSSTVLNLRGGGIHYTGTPAQAFGGAMALQMFGIATGYSYATSGGVTTVHGGIALTPTNLAASAGASGFGGSAFGPGCAITNSTQP